MTYSRAKTLGAFPHVFTFLQSIGGKPNARWRTDGSITRYLQGIAANEDDLSALLDDEIRLCRSALIEEWRRELLELRELVALSQKRLDASPDMRVVFKRIDKTSASRARIDEVAAWIEEAIGIVEFVEFSEFGVEKFAITVRWNDELRAFIKEFDKTEGDAVRRKLAVRGFWLAVASIIISSGISIYTDLATI